MTTRKRRMDSLNIAPETLLRSIPINLLDDHPANPRLVLRTEVIDGIAAQIKTAGVFDPAHALLVRPVDGRFQIVCGHHRRQAAQQVGLTEVPCFVRDMTDDEAFLQLVLGNVQSELFPLELGVHILKYIARGGGATRESCGLSQYAQKIGKTQQHVSTLRQAAEVFENSIPTGNNPADRSVGLLDKTTHLSLIHHTAREVWPILVDWLIAEGPSLKQVQDTIKHIARYSIPDEWAGFLPLADLVSTYLKQGTPSTEDVAHLIDVADGIKQLIIDHSAALGDAFPYNVDTFKQWLSQGLGDYAWSAKALSKYRDAVIDTAEAMTKPKPLEAQSDRWYELGRHRLYCGDTSAPGFIDNLPQCKFAFADPPYNANAAEWDHDFQWHHDYLADKAEIVAVTPGIAAIAKFFREDTQMPYLWSMACWITNGMTRGAVGFGNWIYVSLFGTGAIYQAKQDVIKVDIQNGETGKTAHKGRKPSALLAGLLNLFTNSRDIIIDPFLGSGTTLFVADEQGRTCYGGEIEPEFCNEIIRRWQEKTGMQAKQAE